MCVSTCSSDVLSIKVVAFTLTDAMCQRNIECRVHRDRLSGGVTATVGIRSRNSVITCTANGYGCISGSIVPYVSVCACGCKRHIVTLTETVVAADIDIRQRVHRHCDIRSIRATFHVGGGYCIDTALADIDTVVRAGIAPNVGGATVGGKRGTLTLADHRIS